jgi:hypothetical protein
VRFSIPAGLALAALLVTGCSVGDSETQVSQVAVRFLAAASAGDTATACTLLTPHTREQLTTSDGTSCAEALPADRIPDAPAGKPAVWSDWAKVDTRAGALFLTEMDNGWRVAAAGCTPAGESRPYRCVVGD